eukprot:m.41491 g.41491  ORF g.41491 m.41491 type:complete len:74 (+) comp8218_c0_seq1:3318-3539(+)
MIASEEELWKSPRLTPRMALLTVRLRFPQSPRGKCGSQNYFQQNCISFAIFLDFALQVFTECAGGIWGRMSKA